jgi:iron complex outermembrane receptor protein
VPSPLLPPNKEVNNSAFTYLLTPEFKFSPDFMVYARVASGYRPGGANSNTKTYQIPGYAPDTTHNYELGAKGDFLEHRLSLDASVYYIDWKDIQITAVNPACHCGILENAGNAKSEGIELSLDAKPFENFKVSGWISLNDAVLTQAFPSASGVSTASGDRLPYAARFSGDIAVDESIPFGANGAFAFVGGNLSYIGDRVGIFQPTPTRANLPAYAVTTIHAGVNYSSWKANLFMNNVFDRRGVVDNGMDTNSGVQGIWYIRPRTVGVLLTKTF